MSQHGTRVSTIGRHRLVRKLGEGGMGVVWAAHDPQLDRPVAIKMIRPADARGGGPEDSQARARLLREARTAARVSHPNICPIYEAGEHDGQLYLVMELLEGEPLSARIARGPMPIPEAVPVILAVLAALEALHRAGVVHRDLKPSNVFLTPGGVRLLDFGLARPVTGEATITMDVQATMPGQITGTPRYMAPEQWSGDGTGPPADLFAAGSLLYEMLAGRPTFAGGTVIEIYHAITRERPPALSGGPAVAAVDRVIQRALARRPGDRHAGAAAMAQALREAALLVDDATAVTPVGALKRIVVMPFRMLRADPEIDFLTFSLPDAITASLSGHPSLLVRSTLAAARYAGEAPDLQRLAEEAEVDVVLSGTLLRAGDQVRVSAQLVEAPSGTLVWNTTTQVALGDLFQLQDDLAKQIVGSVVAPLTGPVSATLPRDVPASPRAYEFFLRANELACDRDQWMMARDMYRACLDEDPGFAPAWARRARICRVMAKYEFGDREVCLKEAEEGFQRAFDLNPDLSVAHNYFTNFEVEDLGRNVSAMERLLARARIRANDPELYVGLVLALRYGGLAGASIAAHERARRLDPSVATSVEYTYFMIGDYEGALANATELVAFMPAYARAMIGQEEAAIEQLRRIEKTSRAKFLAASALATRSAIQMDRAGTEEGVRMLLESRFSDPEGIYFIARALAHVGSTERALDELERVVDGGYAPVAAFARDSWLDPIRGHARFRELAARADARHREAARVYTSSGGEALLGAPAR